MEHEHLLALSILLYLAPLAVVAQAAAERAGLGRRLAAAPASTRLSALLLLLAGGVHLGLAAGHGDQPVLALAFAAAAVAQLALAGSAALEIGRWPAWTTAITVAAILAYPFTRALGVDHGVDALGAVTLAIEAATLAVIGLARRTALVATS